MNVGLPLKLSSLLAAFNKNWNVFTTSIELGNMNFMEI
jgi:hypothetical protein